MAVQRFELVSELPVTPGTITREAIEATARYTTQQKDAFQRKAQEEFEAIQKQMATLQGKAGKASVSARTELQQSLHELAILQHVGDAAGHAQVVLEHHKAAVGHHVDVEPLDLVGRGIAQDDLEDLSRRDLLLGATDCGLEGSPVEAQALRRGRPRCR